MSGLLCLIKVQGILRWKARLSSCMLTILREVVHVLKELN